MAEGTDCACWGNSAFHFSKGVLLASKTSPFGKQKDSF